MISLEEDLQQRLKGRITLVGVGNNWRGDDGAGVLLLNRLQGKVKAALIDAGEIPESFLGKIEETKPDTLLFLDAMDLGAEPGTVVLLEEGQVGGTSWDTHKPSLALVMKYLRNSTGASVFLLGIQPREVGFGQGISDQVEETLRSLEDILLRILSA